MTVRRSEDSRAHYIDGKWHVPLADFKVLSRALWDCIVASGEDVSGYCPGGPSDPFWHGTPEQALDAGYRQWAQMYDCKEMASDAVSAVLQLRSDYDEEPK